VPALAGFPPFASLAKAIVKEALRRYPDEPRFRLYAAFAHTRSPVDLDLDELDKIYRDAMREGDTKTAEIAGRAIQAAENLAEPPLDGDFGPLHEQLEEMRRAAAEMSDSEFEQFRKESRKLIPVELFNVIMADVRGKPSRRRRGNRSPDQPEPFHP
jgi:DNA-binding ferritin-like protein